MLKFNFRGWVETAVSQLAACLILPALALPCIAQPNLSGTYDVGTLTPLERPSQFGNRLHLTPAAADQIALRMATVFDQDAQASNPNRAAPQKGTITQGYNLFWLDPGKSATEVAGQYPTSILTKPDDGRIPAMTDYGAQRMARFIANWQIYWRKPDPTEGRDDGTAWWLREGTVGPYDHMEQRPLATRCIFGSRSTAGPPMLPNFYNNHKRIIQTPHHVMILTEMNHDARIIRMNTDHRPNHIKTWLGDSIGRWEGDTLVVDTTNFTQTPPLSGADEQLHVVERFRRNNDGSLNYQFTINDKTIWTSAWGGEYTWRPTEGKVYEYACHEGNYALGNIMRGARLLESQHTPESRHTSQALPQK
ncbi:MAG: hypothetical protein HN856_09930 [Gammaproteobacteria bacterium]|jgi:hypothetical protein|nr:hypothetical protein [Gammaproteobacteria bacterium]